MWTRGFTGLSACLLLSACYSTEWATLPHPKEIEPGARVRVTTEREQVHLREAFIMDDSVLVGTEMKSSIRPIRSIPFSAIQRLEMEGEPQFDVGQTLLFSGIAVVAISTVMSLREFGRLYSRPPY